MLTARVLFALVVAANASELREWRLHTTERRGHSLQPSCLRFRGGKAEHTFAMLKPDVASKAQVVEDVKRMIEEAGLTLEREERCKLSRLVCEEFYAEHR